MKGGWELSGKKFYSTNAGAARFAIVFATPDDADDPVSSLMLFVVDCRGDGVTVNEPWWDKATGMRSTASHEVELSCAFVPDEGVVGEPGDYWTKQVQARYLPQFSSNFQGVGTHIYEYGMSYLQERGRTGSDFGQLHMAEAHIELVAAELMLGRTAELYRERRYPEAFDSARILRAFSELAMRRVIELVQSSCGASIYMHPHPLERILRDWQFYSRHENVELILRAIGRSDFGLGGEGTAAAFGFGGGS